MLARLRLLLVPAGVAFGLVAESVQFGLNDPSHWIPDVAVGWVFIAGGLTAWDRRPDSRSGPLMAATGFAWFFGNFSHTGVAAIDWTSSHAVYVFFGPLIHLLLTYPGGRPSSRLVGIAVAVGYVAAITALWRSEIATVALASLLTAVSVRDFLTTIGRLRRAHLVALWATGGLGALLAGYAVLRLLLPPASISGSFTLAFQGMLIAIAAGLLAGLLSGSWERSAVTDLVVELGEARTGSLRASLAQALADPSLELGYWLPEAGAFVDSEGGRISVPDAGSSRSSTIIQHERQPVAVLVHDPAVLQDPGLSDAVASATQLVASNAQLQAEVRLQLAELRASRRRILDAGDDERRRLERRLREGAERRLTGLAETIDHARSHGSGTTSATIERIDRARVQLDGTLDELRELGRGLHPRVLSELGLAGALALLAERSRVPVDLIIRAPNMPPRIEAAIYFLCSEGLANIAKHAAATRAVMSVEVHDDALWLAISDDGVGGASLDRGSGMRGLADRVDALGGAFHLDSPSGAGTRLACQIPLGKELNSTG
jgi:signal transduction histidine kinase